MLGSKILDSANKFAYFYVKSLMANILRETLLKLIISILIFSQFSSILIYFAYLGWSMFRKLRKTEFLVFWFGQFHSQS